MLTQYIKDVDKALKRIEIYHYPSTNQIRITFRKPQETDFTSLEETTKRLYHFIQEESTLRAYKYKRTIQTTDTTHIEPQREYQKTVVQSYKEYRHNKEAESKQRIQDEAVSDQEKVRTQVIIAEEVARNNRYLYVALHEKAAKLSDIVLSLVTIYGETEPKCAYAEIRENVRLDARFLYEEMKCLVHETEEQQMLLPTKVHELLAL